MSRFRFQFKFDQKRDYYETWLNLDIPVTVIATTREEALRKARVLLPESRRDTGGWEHWTVRVEELEEDELPPLVTEAPRTVRRFRMKGAV